MGGAAAAGPRIFWSSQRRHRKVGCAVHYSTGVLYYSKPRITITEEKNRLQNGKIAVNMLLKLIRSERLLRIPVLVNNYS